jgi:hypothetical protein
MNCIVRAVHAEDAVNAAIGTLLANQTLGIGSVTTRIGITRIHSFGKRIKFGSNSNIVMVADVLTLLMNLLVVMVCMVRNIRIGITFVIVVLMIIALTIFLMVSVVVFLFFLVLLFVLVVFIYIVTTFLVLVMIILIIVLVILVILLLMEALRLVFVCAKITIAANLETPVASSGHTNGFCSCFVRTISSRFSKHIIPCE